MAADPDAAEDFAYDEEELALSQGRLLELDESWHGLHVLLNGREWEVTALSGAAGPAVLGGKAVGPDSGYGPARLLTVAQVAEVAGGLAVLDEQALRARYDPTAWQDSDVYPSVWEPSSWRQELLPGLTALRDFYRLAAGGGQEVLLAIV